MNIYGYVRVSSTDQNEDRQMVALREVPVPEKNISWTNSPARTLTASATKS